MIYFKDPEADRQLILDLNSDKRDIQLAALQLAESNKSPQVLARLLEIIKTSGDFELRIAALHPLAVIGNPAVLPELGQLLKTSSILHRIMLRNFKMEIVRSLERYPALPARQLLAAVPDIGDKELTALAVAIDRKLQTRQP